MTFFLGDTSIDISKLIAMGIKRKNISQKELAEKLNIGQSSVAKWISGKSMPQADKMIEIIRILDLVSEFFPEYQRIGQDKEVIEKGEIEKMRMDMEQSMGELRSQVQLMMKKFENQKK